MASKESRNTFGFVKSGVILSKFGAGTALCLRRRLGQEGAASACGSGRSSDASDGFGVGQFLGDRTQFDGVTTTAFFFQDSVEGFISERTCERRANG